MKTLFLMAIVMILAVIAVKQPNQTAQEAVWELYEKVKTIVMETTAPSSGPDYAKRETAPPSGVPTKPSLLTQEPQTDLPVQPRKKEPADKPAQPTKASGEMHVAENPPAAEWEKLPALPTLPVERETMAPPTVSSSGTDKVAEPSADHAYEEVDVYYQNAKRLLEEMGE